MPTNISDADSRTSAAALQTEARARNSWALFEWARNPYILLITIYIFAPYFSRDIVGDPVRGQALWGDIISYAGLCVAVFAPCLGAIAEVGGRRKPWVAFFAAILFVSTALLWYATPDGRTLSVWQIGVLVALGNVAYDFSLVFHGAMLPTLAPPSRIGRLSGLGYGLGNIAGLVLLVFVLAFIFLPAHPLFGLDRDAHEHERVAGPLCAAWLAVFSVPFFLWTPDRPATGYSLRETVHRGLAGVVRTAKSLRHYRNAGLYLLVRAVYNDGQTALLTFGGVYASGVFHWGAAELALYGIVLSVFAAVGGIFGGRLADRIGAKRAIMLSIAGMILCGLLCLGMAPDRMFFIIPYAQGTVVAPLPVFRTAPELAYIGAVAVIAICIVATYANSRTMLARIAPTTHVTEFFGLYALSGEATAFAAPLAVGFATSASGSQQWGMAAIIAFLTVGLIGMNFVRETRAADA
jgi:UMF1 family MFS transporter